MDVFSKLTKEPFMLAKNKLKKGTRKTMESKLAFILSKQDFISTKGETSDNDETSIITFLLIVYVKDQADSENGVLSMHPNVTESENAKIQSFVA